jgi:copper chaperone CopZ
MFGKKKQLYSEKVKISGMMCQKCVEHVTNALEAVKDVKKVEVSLSTESAVITSTRPLNEEEVKAAITAIGYGYEGLIQ